MQATMAHVPNAVLESVEAVCRAAVHVVLGHGHVVSLRGRPKHPRTPGTVHRPRIRRHPCKVRSVCKARIVALALIRRHFYSQGRKDRRIVPVAISFVHRLNGVSKPFSHVWAATLLRLDHSASVLACRREPEVEDAIEQARQILADGHPEMVLTYVKRYEE